VKDTSIKNIDENLNVTSGAYSINLIDPEGNK
jgi:hypothetical protein